MGTQTGIYMYLKDADALHISEATEGMQMMAVLSRTALQCGTRDAIESAAANCQSILGNKRSGQWTATLTFRVS